MVRSDRHHGKPGHERWSGLPVTKLESVPHRTCSKCGKQGFSSRKAASIFVRRIFPGKRMRYYKCTGDKLYPWHFTSSLKRLNKREKNA